MKRIATIIRIFFLTLFVYLIFTGNMMLWLALFGVSLIAAIFFGRVYCGYMCPMNTVMLPTDWVSKKLKLQANGTPEWLKKGYLPWALLGVSILVMVVSKKALHMNIPILLIWLAVSIFVTLRYRPEVFHNLICPFGVLQRTFGKLAKFSKKVDQALCLGCKKCE